MYPMHIAFSGYALVGLTLFLQAATIGVYLARLPAKSQATRYLMAFFFAVALSGAASVLTNAFVFWSRLFNPWQDFWILAGGVALTHFAYRFPRLERSREATTFLFLMSLIALVAFVYSVAFSLRLLTNPATYPEVSDLFHLLLPLGTLLVVIVFLRRSVAYSRAAGAEGRGWQLLIHPQGRDAGALRALALALSLAFLPGIQTLAGFPPPYGFVLTNIGSLLAITAIALVYFNLSPETTSFMAKLVGITLAMVLLIFSIVGSLDIYYHGEAYWVERGAALRNVYDELLRTGGVTAAHWSIAYVVSWDDAMPDDPAHYRLLFRQPAEPPDPAGFDLHKLIQANSQGYLASSWASSLQRAPVPLSDHPWKSVQRFQRYPVGSQRDYDGLIFVDEGTAYEIGFSQLAIRNDLSRTVIAWLALVLFCALLVLLIFPLFFRATLVRPLQELLAGIRRANSGELGTPVPIHHNDEIGFLARSFNTLTTTLQEAQERQTELLTELQESYDELESRVEDRTRELSAFTDLTRLTGSDQPLAEALQPPLERILETGLCQALCVHLLTEDGAHLELVGEQYLPEAAVEGLASIPLPGAFAARVRNPYDFWANPRPGDLPEKLRIPELQVYLGAPLDVGGRSRGWVSFYRESEDAFQTSECSLLVALGRQIAVIIENHQLRQRIAEVAAVEERQRLARDLHDSATQLLYSLSLFSRSSVDALEEGDTARLNANLVEMQRLSLQALREIRSLLFELQPLSLKEVGLMAALGARFDRVERRVGIEVDFQPLPKMLPEKIERGLYFVATEALNNVLKHANANHISVTFWQSGGELVARIVDNGRGFEPEQASGGLGLENMRQRAEMLHGHFAVESVPGGGTTVVITIPMSEDGGRADASRAGAASI